MRRWRLLIIASRAVMWRRLLTMRLPFDFNPLNLQNPMRKLSLRCST